MLSRMIVRTAALFCFYLTLGQAAQVTQAAGTFCEETQIRNVAGHGFGVIGQSRRSN
jgi:hypothetical protein